MDTFGLESPFQVFREKFLMNISFYDTSLRFIKLRISTIWCRWWMNRVKSQHFDVPGSKPVVGISASELNVSYGQVRVVDRIRENLFDIPFIY